MAPDDGGDREGERDPEAVAKELGAVAGVPVVSGVCIATDVLVLVGVGTVGGVLVLAYVLVMASVSNVDVMTGVTRMVDPRGGCAVVGAAVHDVAVVAWLAGVRRMAVVGCLAYPRFATTMDVACDGGRLGWLPRGRVILR